MRCSERNVAAIPPNVAGVPRQFREARPLSLDEVASVDWAALRDQLGCGVRSVELCEWQPSGAVQADAEQSIRALVLLVVHLTGTATGLASHVGPVVGAIFALLLIGPTWLNLWRP